MNYQNIKQERKKKNKPTLKLNRFISVMIFRSEKHAAEKIWIAAFLCNPFFSGALNPLFCALLPPNVKAPKGKFLYDEEVYDWQAR